MLPSNNNNSRQHQNESNNQHASGNDNSLSSSLPFASNSPKNTFVIGSSIMNSNVSLQSKTTLISDDDEIMFDNPSQTFDEVDEGEEINFDDGNSNNEISIKKEIMEENNSTTSSMALDEEVEEINFDDDQQEQTEDEEINFDDPIIVNSDDESVDFDEGSFSLESIKVKLEPKSNNSSISVNMDELDKNSALDEEDVNLDNEEEIDFDASNTSTKEDVNITNQDNLLVPTSSPATSTNNQQSATLSSTFSTTLVTQQNPASIPILSKSISVDSNIDIIPDEDLDFSMDTITDSATTQQTLSLQSSNIKLEGHSHSLITQPTDSLQQSIASTIDPSTVLPQSPPPSSPTSSPAKPTQVNNIITQETHPTITNNETPILISQYRIKHEKLSNTCQDAISISSDSSLDDMDDDEDVEVEDVSQQTKTPVVTTIPQTPPIDESDEEQQADEEDSSSSSSSSSEEENMRDLDEHDVVSSESGRFHPSLSARRLATAFRMITTDICTGSFCCGGPLFTRLGLPGLQLIVPGRTETDPPCLKFVSFPVATEDQANDIIKLSTRTSRKSNEYYLQANQFIITNPGWNEMVGEVVNQCTRGNLGVSVQKPVSFQLYKMLLLKPGENKRKKDSKLPPNVFAQFLVQLPCAYIGGKKEITFKEEKLEYDFSNTASYLPSYVTYFTECDSVEHNIDEGYKIYLVYNLIYDGKATSKPSLHTVYRVAENLKKIENIWGMNENPFVVHLLESNKEVECRPDLLKGTDLVLYNFLQVFNSQFSLFDLYLGIFERTTTHKPKNLPINRQKVVNDSDDDISNSDDESSYMVKRLTNSNGVVISQMFKIELSDIIPYKYSTSSTRNCLVVIPKKYHYLSLRFMDAKTCYEGFATLFKEFTEDSSKKDMCIELASSQSQSQFFKGKLLELIPMFLQLGNVELVKKFLNPIPILDITTWNILVKHFGVPALRAEFISGLIIFVCYKTADLEKRANQTLSNLESLDDNDLYTEFMTKLLEKIDTVGNNTNGLVLSMNFIISLLNNITRLNMQNETIGRIILRTISISPIETTGDLIYQTVKILFNQNQKQLCHQILENIFRKSTPQFFEKSFGLVMACLSLLGFANIKNKLVEFCNKMITTSTIFSALQVIETSVQKNDESILYLAKYVRKGVINCLQVSQISLALCQKVLGVLYRSGFKDDISTITSIIISKLGMIENSITELLVPLIKWTDKELGKQAFLNPGFNSILQYCINMLRVSMSQMAQNSGDDWSINATVSCDCDHCRSLSAFLRDKTKTRYDFRKAEAQRTHVMISAKGAADKYLSFGTVKDKSPYTLVIQKTSTPNDSEKKKNLAMKELFDYLNRLSQTVMNLNTTSMPSSSSNTSMASTTSAKRTYPSDSDDSSTASIRRMHKKNKK